MFTSSCFSLITPFNVTFLEDVCSESKKKKKTFLIVFLSISYTYVSINSVLLKSRTQDRQSVRVISPVPLALIPPFLCIGMTYLILYFFDRGYFRDDVTNGIIWESRQCLSFSVFLFENCQIRIIILAKNSDSLIYSLIWASRCNLGLGKI